jgi:cytochrome c peroxidase
MKALVAVLLAALVLGAVALLPRQQAFVWDLPDGFPRPKVPADNPMSDAKVELGRWLFYDKRLSGNNTMSCASCHIQSLAFTDARRRSIGSTGEVHPRSAMTLVNSAYASRLTWANPLLAKLEDQALVPLLGDNPIEMGMAQRTDDIATLLGREPRYKALARAAFPNDKLPYSTLNAVRSIAAFVRTLVSFDSPYDHYLAGDSAALTDAAVRGMDLFFSERLECFHCHGGFNFMDSTTHNNSVVKSIAYHNTGLYNLGGSGAYPETNTGLFDMTGERRDMGRFKAPTLRNISLTAPYMHDGSIDTLAQVLEHYSRGGRLVASGELAGDGRLSPFKSEFVSGFQLSADEATDLIAFLHALTDQSVPGNPSWADPAAGVATQSKDDSALH